MSVQQTRRAAYDCPHCRQPLEARVGRWNGWLLCPRCGRPGLPPEVSTDSVANRPAKPIMRREEPARGGFVTYEAEKRPPRSRAASMFLAASSIVLGLMVLLVYLDLLDLGTGMQGLLALALCGLLAKVGKR